MIPPTLGLDINTKHTHLQTLVRQDKARQGEETCQMSRTHRAPGWTRTRMHMHMEYRISHAHQGSIVDSGPRAQPSAFAEGCALGPESTILPWPRAALLGLNQRYCLGEHD